MNESTTLLLWVVLGSVGLGYVVYGRRQRRAVALLAGVGLCVVPYFVSNPYVSLAVGGCLVAAPFLMRF